MERKQTKDNPAACGQHKRLTVHVVTGQNVIFVALGVLPIVLLVTVEGVLALEPGARAARHLKCRLQDAQKVNI